MKPNTGNAATAALNNQQVPFLGLPKPRRRWLLWLATRCYFLFLRGNGWKRVMSPSPLKGGGLTLRWLKNIGGRRYLLTTEDALQSESNLHRTYFKRQAETGQQ